MSRIDASLPAAEEPHVDASNRVRRDFKVSFHPGLQDQLRGEKPDRVAFLVSSEYEGIFHNGGVGTHYRTLSQRLAEDGWHVILLLTYTIRGIRRAFRASCRQTCLFHQGRWGGA